MKTVCKVFILLVIVSFCADRLLGIVFYKIFSSSFCSESYVFSKCNADVVVLGSSRAKHHYSPFLLSDTLGYSCYNLGQNGKNIYYQYAVLNLLLTHHIPKIVVYDCFSVDVMKTDFEYDFGSLSDLYPLYGKNETVDSLINRQGMQYVSRIMLSHLYRFNTRFLDYLQNRSESTLMGFAPLAGSYNKEISIHEENINLTIDETKIYYMKKLIQLCRANNIDIVFSVSPRFALNEEDAPMTRKYSVVRDLCEELNVPFLYYELEPLFLSHSNWFKDIGHLNGEGAQVFSEIFAHDLKQIIGE